MRLWGCKRVTRVWGRGLRSRDSCWNKRGIRTTILWVDYSPHQTTTTNPPHPTDCHPQWLPSEPWISITKAPSIRAQTRVPPTLKRFARSWEIISLIEWVDELIKRTNQMIRASRAITAMRPSTSSRSWINLVTKWAKSSYICPTSGPHPAKNNFPPTAAPINQESV